MLTNKIKDKDKLILVFYINISGMTDKNSKEFICAASDLIYNAFDNSIKCLILPVKDINEPKYKIEAINPKFSNEEEYENLIENLNRFEKYIDDIKK